MRLLVCGGRNYTNYDKVRENVGGVFNDPVYQCFGGNPDVIIHGGAQGADSLAQRVADELGIPTEVFMAEWDKYGRKAGPIRNQRMIDEGKPDIIMVFPGGRGTANCVACGSKAGVLIIMPRHV